MIGKTRLLLLSLLALAVCASVGHASISDVSVLGNGSLTIAGGNAQIKADKSIGFTWVDVSAEDVDIDDDPTTDSGTMLKEWEVKEWWTGPGYTSTITANFTISELLDTTNVGDLASADVLVKMELFGKNGTLISSDDFPLVNGVADGIDLGPESTPVSLSVQTPVSPVDGGNWGKLRVTVTANVSAFTAAQQSTPDPEPEPEPEPDPVVPAPGAIVLASLGMGLVNWLRTRRTL